VPTVIGRVCGYQYCEDLLPDWMSPKARFCCDAHRAAAYRQRRHAKDQHAEELTEQVENLTRQLADRDAQIAGLRRQVQTLVAQHGHEYGHEHNGSGTGTRR
jgi:hypothetical protein